MQREGGESWGEGAHLSHRDTPVCVCTQYPQSTIHNPILPLYSHPDLWSLQMLFPLRDLSTRDCRNLSDGIYPELPDGGTDSKPISQLREAPVLCPFTLLDSQFFRPLQLMYTGPLIYLNQRLTVRCQELFGDGDGDQYIYLVKIRNP